MGATASKYKLGARAGKYKLWARAGKYKSGVRTDKYKLGASAGGQAKVRGPENTNTLDNAFYIASLTIIYIDTKRSNDYCIYIDSKVIRRLLQ